MHKLWRILEVLLIIDVLFIVLLLVVCLIQVYS
jgi:hypothetical protein